MNPEKNYSLVVVYNYNDFYTLFKNNHWLDAQAKINSELSKLQIGNRLLVARMVNIHGDEFLFQTSEHDTKMTIWNLHGILVAEVELEPLGIDSRLINAIKRTEEWSRGLVHCSDCGIVMNYQEALCRTIYAGIYCPDCYAKIEQGFKKGI